MPQAGPSPSPGRRKSRRGSTFVESSVRPLIFQYSGREYESAPPRRTTELGCRPPNEGMNMDAVLGLITGLLNTLLGLLGGLGG